MPSRAFACAVLLTLVTASETAAQTAAPLPAPAVLKKVSFGVKGGANFATIADNFEDPPAPFAYERPFRRGFIFGGYLLVSIHGSLGIQTEVLYAQKGSNFRITVTSGGTTETPLETTTRLSYVEVPALVRYTFRQSGRARPYAYAGPSFAFRTSANASGTSTSRGNTESYAEDISNVFRAVDVGIAAGGGVEFGRLVLDARFTNGLTNVYTLGFGEGRNRTFSLMVGVRF